MKQLRMSIHSKNICIQKKLTGLKIELSVEGRFGVGKRRYGLGLIKSKLKETSETDIYVSILVLNLDKMCAQELAEIKNKYRINRENTA